MARRSQSGQTDPAGIEGLLTQPEQNLGAIHTAVVGQAPLVGAIKDTLVKQEQRLGVLGQIEPGMAGIKDALAKQTLAARRS